MKVAFASENGKQVDAHFGRCSSFSIFEVDDQGYKWLCAREISESAGLESEKIDRRVDAVRDCTLLFLCQIGPSAAAKITRAGIMPLKVEEGTVVVDQLERLREMLSTRPPIWLKKAMLRTEEAEQA